jgi:hypothetical protein
MIVVIGVGILLLGLIAFLILSTGPKPAVTWLPSARVVASGPPSKMALAKAKLLDVTAPLWRPCRRNPRMIAINVNILKLAEGTSVADFGIPVATNANGAKVWVLSADSIRRFVPPIGASVSNPRLVMPDGGRGVMQMGNSAMVLGTNKSVNVRLSVAPKIVSSSIRLELGVDLGTAASSLAVITNVLACLARIPDGGALVAECPQTHDAAGKHFWFVVEPTTWVPGPVTPAAKAYTTTPRHGNN